MNITKIKQIQDTIDQTIDYIEDISDKLQMSYIESYSKDQMNIVIQQ